MVISSHLLKKREVVYLNLDDEELHELRMVLNFTDFIFKWLNLEGFGTEDWQISIPHSSELNLITLENENSKKWIKYLNVITLLTK